MPINRRRVPGLYIDADMKELAHANGVLTRFTQEMNTAAYKQTVTDAVHRVFSQEFDRHMAMIAKASKENYHHLYDYNPAGGYGWIGTQKAQLWIHTKRQEGGSRINFSWEWKPARQYNPTYSQRRSGRLGHDAMRNIPFQQFQDLLRHSNGKRHRFVWKAPMLEYGIIPSITPKEAGTLAVPVHTVKSPALAKKRGSGPNLLFLTFAQPEHNAPGPTVGNFTEQWVLFWSTIVPNRFEDVFAEIVAKDAAKNIASAIAKKKPATRSRKRKWELSAVTDFNEAFAAGQQQALTAIKSNKRSIKQIEMRRGTYHNAGLV